MTELKSKHIHNSSYSSTILVELVFLWASTVLIDRVKTRNFKFAKRARSRYVRLSICCTMENDSEKIQHHKNQMPRIESDQPHKSAWKHRNLPFRYHWYICSYGVDRTQWRLKKILDRDLCVINEEVVAELIIQLFDQFNVILLRNSEEQRYLFYDFSAKVIGGCYARDI